MTKSGLIEEVARRTPHISKKDTEVVVNTIFDAMTDALRRGERIEIRGFGSFQVKVREARDGGQLPVRDDDHVPELGDPPEECAVEDDSPADARPKGEHDQVVGPTPRA